ncbi:hypothetical protein GCM10010193_31380 [Kitasatospora atroaurantiaca]|uniref:Uncharacterized membrane protein YidH (DUF202 family) n=1 Tax=Kitasatospora atroaurantiaca TaxID=285545 RepID=A0A561ERA7_9ACTN|nr:DUF202 domain-containing protein [Kitasatospora atroaurantiaca]TWE18124.1 uncharacterized membrane protein YidH (DUF202 family) [Kitasatospora atroaurantiaca]
MNRLPAPRDRGLQPERTLLAWSRTALVLTVNAGLVLRTGLVNRQPGLTVLGALLVAAACVLCAHGLHRRRRLELPGHAPEPIRAAPLRAVVVLMALVAAASCWCVLLGPPGD